MVLHLEPRSLSVLALTSGATIVNELTLTHSPVANSSSSVLGRVSSPVFFTIGLDSLK